MFAKVITKAATKFVTAAKSAAKPAASSVTKAAAGAMVLGLLVSGCAITGGLKKPTMEVTEMRVAGFDRESLQLTVLVKIDNPNSTEISLTDIQAKVYVANQELAKAESTQAKVILPASGSLLLPMRVNVPFKTLPDALRQSIAGIVAGGMAYKIEGSVTTFNGLLTVPFEKTGQIAKRR